MTQAQRSGPAHAGPPAEDLAGPSVGQDDAAERAVVGSLLLAGPVRVREILDAIQDEDFAEPRCAFIASVIRRMDSEGMPVDPLTVAGYVERHGLLGPGKPRMVLSLLLHELAGAAPVPASGTWYARIVVEQAARRRAVYAAHEIERAAGAADLGELREALTEQLSAAVRLVERAGANA